MASEGRSRTWGLCQRFLSEAETRWRHDPALALSHAAIGVRIADALDEERHQARWVADLRAKAHAFLGNSYRILSRFSEAERELTLAEAYVRQGVGSGLRESRVTSLRASLLIDRGRRYEAEHLLTRIEHYYRTTGQRLEPARTRLKHAAILAFREQYRAAAEECARASANLDPQQDGRLTTLACQNATHYLVHAGEVGRARGLFASLPPTDERMVRLHRWIEADLLRAERKLDLAMAAYDDVRRRYADEDHPYDVALVSLDQALTAYEMGDPERMLDLAQEAGVLLNEANAPTEALAVLRGLAAAFDQGTVTQTVLAAIRERVADARPTQ